MSLVGAEINHCSTNYAHPKLLQIIIFINLVGRTNIREELLNGRVDVQQGLNHLRSKLAVLHRVFVLGQVAIEQKVLRQEIITEILISQEGSERVHDQVKCVTQNIL